jgi:hypothetical protein
MSRYSVSALAAFLVVALAGVVLLNWVPEGWPVVGALGGLVVLWFVLTELILVLLDGWNARRS